MNVIDQIEQAQTRETPPLKPGQRVRVHVRIVEGEKERIQVFEGVVIGISGSGNRETFMVRKTSYGVGVERIFPLHSPTDRESRDRHPGPGPQSQAVLPEKPLGQTGSSGRGPQAAGIALTARAPAGSRSAPT